MNRLHFLQITDDKFFAEIMVNHYTKLYKQRMKGWHFVSAAFAWKRAQWYKRQVAELDEMMELTDRDFNLLLTEINNTHECHIITLS